MNHIFEPLCKKPRSVILDTDIGPDCDDVGALVCLIDYAKKYGFPILGICNCTSNKAGTGTIDAVCRHCGIETPYLGQWHGEGFQDEPACHKYNDAVAEKFSEAYRNGTLKTADEVTFYRTLLAGAEDDSVMIITIGMFNDLAALLRSGADEISPLSGMELVKAKVNCLVSMAAILPEGRECNVISDYKAAEVVFNEWPTAVYLSDFHIGWKIMTGYDHIQDPAVFEAHPLALAYHLYTRGWTHLPAEGMNSSYDLTAIQFAVEGEGEFYSLLDPVDLEFYAAIPEQPDLADATRAVPNPEGKFRFMKKEASDEVIRDSLNRQVDQMQVVMTDLQQRDDNLYRVLFGAEPIPLSIRQGAQRKISYYEELARMTNNQLSADLTLKVDILEKELYVQAKSYEEVMEMAKNQEIRMENIPAIQPVMNKDLKRVASGYGMRIDPVYHVRKFHQGMDFTAPTGTEVFATGNAKVKFTGWKQGYGNTVILDHGFGYETLYAHLYKSLVRKGQKVRRSDIIALVGNTGKSTGPHLHYEVRLNGRPVDPRNYYFYDLSPEEYDQMIQLSNNFGQMLD